MLPSPICRMCRCPWCRRRSLKKNLQRAFQRHSCRMMTSSSLCPESCIWGSRLFCFQRLAFQSPLRTDCIYIHKWAYMFTIVILFLVTELLRLFRLQSVRAAQKTNLGSQHLFIVITYGCFPYPPKHLQAIYLISYYFLPFSEAPFPSP